MVNAESGHARSLDPDIRRFVSEVPAAYANHPAPANLAERRALAELVRKPWTAGGSKRLRTDDVFLLLLSMLLVGVAWASILSMPYAMLSNSIPAEKMGFYMGVFNFFIVIPQIIAAVGLGPLMQHVLGDNAMLAVLLGGCSMVAAAVAVAFVSKEVDADAVMAS